MQESYPNNISAMQESYPSKISAIQESCSRKTRYLRYKKATLSHPHSPRTPPHLHYSQPSPPQTPRRRHRMTITCTNPADTLRNNDVVITSIRRHNDVITSKWRRFDVITTSSLRRVFIGNPPVLCLPVQSTKQLEDGVIQGARERTLSPELERNHTTQVLGFSVI